MPAHLGLLSMQFIHLVLEVHWREEWGHDSTPHRWHIVWDGCSTKNALPHGQQLLLELLQLLEARQQCLLLVQDAGVLLVDHVQVHGSHAAALLLWLLLLLLRQLLLRLLLALAIRYRAHVASIAGTTHLHGSMASMHARHVNQVSLDRAVQAQMSHKIALHPNEQEFCHTSTYPSNPRLLLDVAIAHSRPRLACMACMTCITCGCMPLLQLSMRQECHSVASPVHPGTCS